MKPRLSSPVYLDSLALHPHEERLSSPFDFRDTRLKRSPDQPSDLLGTIRRGGGGGGGRGRGGRGHQERRKRTSGDEDEEEEEEDIRR
jgi:hypothetical protein